MIDQCRPRAAGALLDAALAACFLLPLSAAGTEPEGPTRAANAPHPVPVAAEAGRWMAVTANPYASEAAAGVLRAGGHAVDAAIAAQLVLNLVEPQSSGIGGGGFMLVWNQSAQTLRAWDGRETAPKAVTADDYQDAAGQALTFAQVVREGKAVGVPGLVAMMAQAHARDGRLPWARLFEPAIRLAESGFLVSPRLNALLDNDRLLRDDAHAAALYYPDEKPAPSGLLLRNPALAQTYRRIAAGGPRAFYEGDLPRAMISAIKAKTGNTSRLVEQDFRDYQAIERPAICAPVLSSEVCGMPPPSAGGIAVLQMLRLIELQERKPGQAVLKQAGPRLQWLPERLLPWLKASRLAYEDRVRHVGDPDRVEVPVNRLVSLPYLRNRLDGFRLSQTVPESSERPSTTHLSVVDAEGNAVALTSSIEDQFGSRIMVNGFLLNNQLTDFDLRPSSNGVTSPNAIEPGKRPRSSMSPTLVFSQGNPKKVLGVTGSPGGPQIPAYVASRLYAHWWGGHPVAQALAAPHITLRESRLDVEAHQVDTAWLERIRQTLPALPGRDELPVNLTSQTSGIHWIVRTPGGWLGVADPRREGLAIGE